MCVGSDPAGSLNKMVGIPGIPALKNQLDSSEHLTRTPGILDLASLDLDFDAKVSFNSGNGVYHYSVTHIYLSSYLQIVLSSSFARWLQIK
jgi:hypothetical protein